MPYVYLNLFRPGTPWQLDPDAAVIRLQERFPEVIVLPGDQLVRSAQHAERQLDSTESAQKQVIDKLWWDADHSGPAYAFYFPAGTEPRVDGIIKRYQADFVSDTPLSESFHARIVDYLQSLIPPGADVSIGEESDEAEPAFPQT
jgi:hypothetical protein